MNKFLICAISALALVAVVRAEEEDVKLDEKEYSTFKLATDDATETARLGEQFKDFDQFCLQSRDYIIDDIKSRTNQLSANVFTLIFDSAEAMGRQTLSTQKMGAERLAGQLANPSASIADPTSEAERIIAEGQARVSERSQPMSFFEAVKSVAMAGASTFQNMLNERFNRIKSAVSWDTLAKTSTEACNQVAAYEVKIKADFDAYKNQVGQPELAMNRVPCVTSTRISQVDGLCRFAMAIKEAADKVKAKANAQ